MTLIKITVALANGTTATLFTCSECGDSLCPCCIEYIAKLQEESHDYCGIVSDLENDEPIPF